MKIATVKSCILSLLVLGFASLAEAGTISQTLSFPAQLFFEGAAPFTHSETFTGTFDQFDPTLGTLDEVSFVLDFDFDAAISSGGGGGVNGTVHFDNTGNPAFIGGGGGFGSGVAGVYPVDQLYDTSTAPHVIDAIRSDFIGTGSVDLVAMITATVGAPIPDVRIDLVDDLSEASMTLNYNYTSVPEPTAVALLMIAGAALLTGRALRQQ